MEFVLPQHDSQDLCIAALYNWASSPLFSSGRINLSSGLSWPMYSSIVAIDASIFYSCSFRVLVMVLTNLVRFLLFPSSSIERALGLCEGFLVTVVLARNLLASLAPP